jgi:putative flippase GtrA
VHFELSIVVWVAAFSGWCHPLVLVVIAGAKRGLNFNVQLCVHVNAQRTSKSDITVMFVTFVRCFCLTMRPPLPRIRRLVRARQLRRVSQHRALALRYTSVSLMATALDFSVFYVLGLVGTWPDSTCALVSAASGGLLAWWLYRFWVFADSTMHKWKIRSRYLMGVIMAILLNSLLVGLFSDLLDCHRMIARIFAATTTWALLYMFNRRVVFNI